MIWYSWPMAAVAAFDDEILQAAVAAGLRLPLPRQVEVPEGVGGDDVAMPARVGAVGRRQADRAVFDDPAQAGDVSGLLYPRQPAVLEPSNSSRQPAAFSAAVSVLGSSAAPMGATSAAVATAASARREKYRVVIPTTITSKLQNCRLQNCRIAESEAVTQMKPDLIVRSEEPLNIEGRAELLMGQETPVEHFFVRSHGPVPEVDAGSWRLRVEGLVKIASHARPCRGSVAAGGDAAAHPGVCRQRPAILRPASARPGLGARGRGTGAMDWHAAGRLARSCGSARRTPRTW